ncbi:MAG: phage tail tape measure protein, partial [Vagococcus sp.]
MSGGTPLGNMVIKVGLDDAEFGKGVENSKKQVRYLAKEMQANMKIADMAGNQLGKLGTRYDGLTKIIGAQEKQVQALKKAYDESFVDGKATDSTKRLAAQLQDANGKLANYKQQLINTAGAMAEYKVRNEGFTGAINKASDSLIKNGQTMENYGGKLTKGITLPLVSGAAAVTTAAISWESAFAGVKKTVDEVVDSNGRVTYSYKDLENGLRGLAKELPSSHKEIAAVAEAAGQLGIETPNVVGFTKTMIDLGESTSMSAETAATELARFANITGMSQDKFSNLGSALVDLGNNFATTEGEVSAMALRLAGAGTQIGMTEGEILGFSAALSSVGVEAEAGGSAFSKVMIQMQLATEKGMVAFDELNQIGGQTGVSFEQMSNAVEKGGKSLKATASQMGLTSKELSSMYKEADKSATSLENFAQVAGMTNAEFGNMFKNDPSKAIMKFVEGLSKAEEQGTSAIKVLDDMDITEVRLRDSLLRAANASGTFSSAVEMGNKAFSENTALAEEAGKRYETTESKLKMLKNEAVDAAIDLGGPFVDALRSGLEASKPLIKGLGDLAKKFSEMDPKTQRTIVGFVGAAAAAGPLLSVTGKLTSKVGGLGKAFVDLSAKSAKKKAIAEITGELAKGTLSVDTLSTSLVAGATKFGTFGTAASSASGASGVGAMISSITTLNPFVLGLVGAGGALALGYGAWKLWGEEAWNSAQRTKQWGSDVGSATDEALTKFKGYSEGAIGEMSLVEQG